MTPVMARGLPSYSALTAAPNGASPGSLDIRGGFSDKRESTLNGADGMH